jgi:hypothetical protein
MCPVHHAGASGCYDFHVYPEDCDWLSSEAASRARQIGRSPCDRTPLDRSPCSNAALWPESKIVGRQRCRSWLKNVPLKASCAEPVLLQRTRTLVLQCCTGNVTRASAQTASGVWLISRPGPAGAGGLSGVLTPRTSRIKRAALKDFLSVFKGKSDRLLTFF